MRDRAGDAAELTVTVPQALAGLRLDQALARLFPQYSRTRLQVWLREGAIALDARPATARQTVIGGEQVRLVPPPLPDAAAPQAEKMPLAIVYEDADILVIDKPAGLVVHPGAGVHRGTLLNALLAHAPQLGGLPRAGIVHRLDRDTSGLLVVAKTLEAQTSLVRQLAERSMQRVYLAVVHGVPSAGGTIDQPIGRDLRSRTRMAITRRGREARTRYQVVERFDAAALIECRLETGRTHQIRVHLQHLGYPIVGDPVYRRGASARISFGRQALHARELSLAHPRSGEPMTWRAPLPADMKRLIATLRRA
ncbi:MAG: ribosomal large subunit pseudouridine synthase D [Betaproteobacteria bacterium SG8_39]|nr:MAG: ribosomal large subunit pseudouridine synthase D [Betaproteobacteria bacterium SG8_39]